MPRIRRGRRRAFAVQVSMKRPIDKKLLSYRNNIVGSAVGGQTTFTLYTTTFPGTITGIRWDFAFGPAGSGATTWGDGNWTIQIVRDGVQASVINNNAAISDMVAGPEQNVLAAGNYSHANYASGEIDRQVGMTKTQRKLMGGDTIKFSVINWGTAVTGDTLFKGVFQFFVKS